MEYHVRPFKKPIILVHGGAGSFSRRDLKEYKSCLKDAVTNGYKVLRSGSAVEGVIEAVKIMEDCGHMNAGIGSVLNLHGYVEMDAGIMDGKAMRAAGVALVRKIKNPILLAKVIMEHTDHVLLAGDFAEKLGEKLGLKTYDIVPREDMKRKYNELYLKLLKGDIKYLRRISKLVKKHKDIAYGTVGAVALDKEGRLAAATSTGGYWLKLPGRIGDTPIVGAGFYADKDAAASSTGIGEYILIAGLCRKAVELVKAGLNAAFAAIKSIEYMSASFGENTAGLIIVDSHGYVGAAFNTKGMGRAMLSKSHKEPVIAIFKDEPFI